jgi:hypothetical protein
MLLLVGVLLAVAVLIIPKLSNVLDTTKRDIWTREIPDWFGRVFYGGIQGFAKFWHDYEIHGIENVSSSNCLLVGYHSRPTVDGVYATAFLEPTTIMSPLFFAVPGSGYIFSQIHCISSHVEGASSDESFVRAVVGGHRPVVLFPGGHHECYKQFGDQYQAQWKELPGYARVLLAEPDRPGRDTKVVPFFTNSCEDIYPTTDSWYNFSGKMVVDNFRNFENGSFWLLPLLGPQSICALGFVLLPRPVKLDLYIGRPVTPLEGESAVVFASRVKTAMQALIDECRAANPTAKQRSWLHMWINYPLYCTFVIFQNLIMWSAIIVLMIVTSPLVIVYHAVMRLLKGKRKEKSEHKKEN